MRISYCGVVLVGLLLLCSAAAATNVTLISSSPWLVAGSGGNSTIYVTGAMANVPVDLSLSYDGADDSTLTPLQVTTDDHGNAKATFYAGTKSGNVTITADGTTGYVVQRVDHGTPSTVRSLNYTGEVTAGTTTPIVIRMADRWGNIIDNRRTAENVSFSVGSPTDNAHFENGASEITAQPDVNGDVRVDLTTDTRAGENILYITFPGDISPRYLTVTGLANGEPSEIYQTVSPKVEDPDEYPEQPLDKQFSIIYSLYDQYGNPAGDRQIKIEIRPVSGSLKASELIVTTNSLGKAMITYGPSESAGVANIVATAADNSSVSCSQLVSFYSNSPTNLILTAVPQTIASRDVKSDIVAHVKAKITDTKGNPVRNESVSFTLIGVDNGTYILTEGPEISNSTLTSGLNGTSLVTVTDKDGFATVDLHPGAFTRDTSNPRYSNMASGNATIQATWNGKSESTTVSFRNYPYLSVRTSVEPQTVAVNETVNVTVQLIGDGWALQSRPIDVVLCTDRSGSMLENTTQGGGDRGWVYDSRTNQWVYHDEPDWVTQESVDDRMVHAMVAAKNFTSQMKSWKDRIGLVSFGQKGTTDLDTYGYEYWAGNDYKQVWHNGDWWHEGYWGWEYDDSDDSPYIAAHYKNPQYYSSSATRDLELTLDYTDVDNTIDNWLPCGGTPMREGLYRSVRMILDHPRTADDPVKAIVLLTDGEWNTGGDPEGGRDATSFSGVGTGSVIQYAKDNGIKIFTIALGNEPNHAELQSYADQTGGKFYSATAGDDLTQVYEDIAQKLQEAAGVNTTMDLKFDSVMINTTPTSDVFDYQPLTKEFRYWTNNNSLIWGPEFEDQSDDWADERSLSFNVGDIYLNQTWETTFCLKVKKAGNIDIFGNDSRILFNGTQGTSELSLPHTFVTALQNLNRTNATASWIDVTDLSVSKDSNDFICPSWDLTYTGNRSVVQEVKYQFSSDNVWWNGNWQVADTITLPSGTDVNGTYSSRIDTQGKSGYYKIRVSARDIPEGVSDEETYGGVISVGMENKAYIKLE